MTKTNPQHTNLTDTIKKLRSISEWFESQDEVDVEKGLELVREGATLIASGRTRLRELQNEFEEIKKKLDEND